LGPSIRGPSIPASRKVQGVGVLGRIRLEPVCLAHPLGFEAEDFVLDDPADEVRSLAFGVRGDPVNGLQSRFFKVDQDLGITSASICTLSIAGIAM
jgi:hypothetical protein